MAGPILTAEQVRKLFDYDASTGHLTWRVRPANWPAGRPLRAGGLGKLGYVKVRHSGRTIAAHRLVWLHFYGEWPNGPIDHINCDRADNRIANLRVVNDRINRENRRQPDRRNSTGFLGVSRNHRHYKASISVRGVRHNLGNFWTAEEAHVAYINAKRKLHEGCTL